MQISKFLKAKGHLRVLALILCLNLSFYARGNLAGTIKETLVNANLAVQTDESVKGTVTDETDLPIPGVSVIVKGTTIGVLTDANGQFTIHVTKGQTLVFSFIGYETKEIVSNGANTLNISLTPKINELNEIVVNGYSSQKRSDVTAAISTVSGKTLMSSPVTNVTNALAGNVPGLIV
jgi:hypothetical protein